MKKKMDHKLMKSIKDAHKESKKKERKAGKKADKVLSKEVKAGKKELKVEKVMREYKRGKLHSGSKKGPKVKSRKQAVAIALSEARKAGAKIPKKK